MREEDCNFLRVDTQTYLRVCCRSLCNNLEQGEGSHPMTVRAVLCRSRLQLAEAATTKSLRVLGAPAAQK